MYAQAVHRDSTGDPITYRDLSKRDRSSVRSLEACGLLIVEDSGLVVDGSDSLRELLETQPPNSGLSVTRFFENGRLQRTPSRLSDHRSAIEHLADICLQRGERISERELMERLSEHALDPVGRRREMVEFGFVKRTKDGSLYWRA
ncbi:DUF2087 domain-containing protein [Sanguibacter antarcticus]|uniref:DUF2087 domain-containing protein n=1 Tax=Sanguibacter antarcticus TaxID=372484 RepID=UPI003CCC2AC3